MIILAFTVFFILPITATASTPSKTTLSELVKEGVEHNLSLLADQFEIEIARAEELTSGLWANPIFQMVNSLVPLSTNWNQTNAGGPTQTDLILNFPIDISGKISNAKKVASIAVKEEEANFQNKIRLKIGQIEEIYFSLLALQQQIQLLEEKTIALQHLQNKHGNSHLLTSCLHLAEIQRHQKQAQYRMTQIAFLELLGRESNQMDFEIVPPQFTLVKLEPSTKKNWIEIGLAERPDLQSLKLTKDRMVANHDLVNSRKWDNLLLGVGLTSQFTILPHPNDPGSSEYPQVWSGDLAFLIPLPVFNRNQRNILKAIHQESQTDRQLQALTLSIKDEIESLLVQVQSNEELIKEYKEEYKSIIKRGKKFSYVPLKEFDQVETVYSNYYSYWFDYWKSISKLNAAIGRKVIPY
jgi:cobalt-zinc-cadmium efflux system outer membrane protein